MDLKTKKKIYRKTKRCEIILKRHEGLDISNHPTRSIFIGNGGLGCGFTQEILMSVFDVYGRIEKIVLLVGKPYTFIVFADVDSALKAVSFVHGQKLSSGHIFYLSYIEDSDVPIETGVNKSLPEGLILLEDFISEEQEIELLQEIRLNDYNEISEKSLLKHRQVKHYGYEFMYGSNNINKKEPLDRKIPKKCIEHLNKLVSLGFLPRIPEQLTVNHYLPGQGIPPHIDTHSAFEDGIVSLSLSSQVVMDFSLSDDCVSVLLPRRSALIMLGKSRYLWKHGITPRKTDVITTKEGLTLSHRSPRTSLTFRLLREGPCTCDYKEQCDSQTLYSE